MGAYSLQSCHSNMTTKTKPLFLWFLGNFPMKLGSRKMPLFNLWLLPGFDRVHLFLVPQIPATFSKKSIQQYPKGELLCLPSYQISAPKRNSILSMSYKRIEKIGNSLCLLDQVGSCAFFLFDEQSSCNKIIFPLTEFPVSWERRRKIKSRLYFSWKGLSRLGPNNAMDYSDV